MALRYHALTPAQSRLAFARTWSKTAGIWGIGAGTAALFVLSVTPLVRQKFLAKIPVASYFFEDKVPASDKPF